MYNHTGLIAGSTPIAALPFTGFSMLWFGLAGFALLTAGGSLLRILPRKS